jgi:hypothetical protein
MNNKPFVAWTSSLRLLEHSGRGYPFLWQITQRRVDPGSVHHPVVSLKTYALIIVDRS